MENPISRAAFSDIETRFSVGNSSVRESSSPLPSLEFGSFQISSAKLDHSHQTFKAYIAKSGALGNRRPPSRSSRPNSRKSSSAESFTQLNDFAGFEVFEPKIVNIEVQLEDHKTIPVNPCLITKQSVESEVRFASSIKTLPTHCIGEKSSNDVTSILKNVSSLLKSAAFKSYSTPEAPFPACVEETYDNLGSSSSETEVIISDKESIADSGIVNRRTVIKINEKSKSATSLEDTSTLHAKERRLYESEKYLDSSSLSPSLPNIDFSGGINVSITSQKDNSKDSTSRMYVRQSDSENRSTRASAFNVRRTIEKRQLQQERRQRKALRDRIREKLKNFSESRQRKESISSNASSDYSSASNRSKSLNSLHEDQDHSIIERPIFKVQSSPTLDSEKNDVRAYLFGNNLDGAPIIKSSKLVANIMPTTSVCSTRFNELKETNKKPSESSDQVPNYFKAYSQLAKIKFHDLQDTHNFDIKKSENNSSGDYSPEIPPRRRTRVSRSTGQLTVEKEERPAWLRLAKERRSLRSQNPQNWDNFSDIASSIVTPEPDWVAKARQKLESMNVCLTSTTDTVSVNSQITESSSAWSRGGLDALDDLREEVSRISEQLADEATERVVQELGIENRGRKMLEFHKSAKSRESSSDRQRVSFDESAKQNVKSSRLSPTQKIAKDEIKFGDLKHDWGGVQSKLPRSSPKKVKETRFVETHTNESLENKEEEKKSEIINRQEAYPVAVSVEHKPVIHFGDNPSDIFSKKTLPIIKSQSSSKFESIAGPDPFNMTAEQLNQNVEEYDFPIPTGNEDTEELLTFLRDSLNKAEVVPEIVSTASPKLKPRSILKKSTENIQLDIQEEVSDDLKSRKITDGGKNPCNDRGQKLSCLNQKHHEAIVSPVLPYNPNDCSFKPINSTNPINSITNAASSFFNVKLRHVGSKNNNKCLEAEDCERYKPRSTDLHKERRHTDCGIEFSSLKSTMFVKKESTLKKPNENTSKIFDINPTTHVKELDNKNDDISRKRNLKNNALSNHEKVVSVIRFTNGIVSKRKLPKPSTQMIENSCERMSHMTASVQNKQSWHFCRAGKIEQSNICGDHQERTNECDAGLKKSLSFSIKPSERNTSDNETCPVTDEDSDSPEPQAPKRPMRQTGRFASSHFQSESASLESSNNIKKDYNFPVLSYSFGNNDHSPRRNLRDSKMYSSLRDSNESSQAKRVADQYPPESYPIVADRQRRSLPASLDKHKGKNFLFEWERIQRKKLEEEENIHKQSSLKPASSKIKDIVKLHSVSTLKSIFTKDRKSQYNGTVDATEDIFFQKIPGDSKVSSAHNCSMKSPSIVQRITQISKPKPAKVPEEIDKSLSNYERQAFSFNQRNIYLAEESSPLNKTKIEQISSSPKKYLSSAAVKSLVSNFEKPQANTPETKTNWVKNIMNSLPSDIKESSKNRSKPIEERLSVYRRSFHECLPRKEKDSKEQIMRSSYVTHNKFSEEKSKNLTDNERITPTTRSNSPSKSLVSSSWLKESASTAIKTEKENICPKESDCSKKYDRIKSIRERIDAINNVSPKFKSEEKQDRYLRALSPVSMDDSVFSKSRENSPFPRYSRERSPSIRSTSSVLSTIENESRPVSLSSILERDISSPLRSSNRRGSASEELNELTKKYRKDRENSSNIKNSSYGPTKYSSTENNNNNIIQYSHTSYSSANNKNRRSNTSPSRTFKKQIKESRIYNKKTQSDKEKKSNLKKDSNHTIKHTSISEFTKPTSKVVKRKSSFKKIRSKDIAHKRNLLEEDLKKFQKKDSDTNSERYESIKRTPGGGWTKTSVRKTRLGSANSDKSMTKKGKSQDEKNFRNEASNILEKWAAGTKVHGKLLKKEGQRYSHQVEEVEKEGKKSTKAVGRRIVRRGSRRLSHGGELVSETKVASSGDPATDAKNSSNSNTNLVQYTGSGKDGVSRKMKSSTDGERYVTQSVHTTGGIQKMTTTGVDNKTIKSQEIIGGRGWEGKREVANSLGEKLTVERSTGAGCRPSTVVKKATTQSKFVITKTKKKVPII